MHLNDHQLQEFRNRCLQAVFNGYTIAHADEYMATLAKEVGQDIVPEGVSRSSAQHLLDLADEALALRANSPKSRGFGAKKPKPEAKKAEPVKEPEPVKEEPKVEPVVETRDETPTTPPPAPEPSKEEPVEAKTEVIESKHSKTDDHKHSKKK